MFGRNMNHRAEGSSWEAEAKSDGKKWVKINNDKERKEKRKEKRDEK